MRFKPRLFVWVTKMVTGHVASAVGGVPRAVQLPPKTGVQRMVWWIVFLGSPDYTDLISVVYYGSSDILLTCNHLK